MKRFWLFVRIQVALFAVVGFVIWYMAQTDTSRRDQYEREDRQRIADQQHKQLLRNLNK